MQPQQTHRALRSDSAALKVLSAIANGVVNIAIDTGKATSIPRGSLTRLIWSAEKRYASSNTEIDIERILRDTRERTRYNRAVATLRKRRYAKLIRKGDQLVLEVTADGERRLAKMQIDTLRIAPQKRWDKKWRIILFDIPEKQHYSRKLLRQKLAALGFFQFQQSAFVCPYPCEDELDVITQYLNIQEFVTFFTTDSLGYQEINALHYFSLKR
jgi:hypothetical protein